MYNFRLDLAEAKTDRVINIIDILSGEEGSNLEPALSGLIRRVVDDKEFSFKNSLCQRSKGLKDSFNITRDILINMEGFSNKYSVMTLYGIENINGNSSTKLVEIDFKNKSINIIENKGVSKEDESKFIDSLLGGAI